jgi:outer membrane protein assembly factor BamB
MRIAAVNEHVTNPTFRTLRAWPAVALALLIAAARFGPALFEQGASKYWMVAVFGPMLCCLLMLVWWFVASRATWRERVLGGLGIVAAGAVAVGLAHPTMRGAGTSYFTLPTGFFLFGLTLAFLKNTHPGRRTPAAVLVAFAGFLLSTVVRNDGMTGDYAFTLRPRWTRTAEDVMLASPKRVPGPTNVSSVNTSAPGTDLFASPEWPAFRGLDRAGVSIGPKIATNWNTQPPRQLWKIPVGPGWSSFAVAGRKLFTQEQRGPKEAVVCYDADSGQEIWTSEIEARLDDPMGGPGPRATPTIANGALYVTGSTGAFMRMDPATGQVLWKKDLKEVAGRKVPMWGFSASPLLEGNLAIVYGGGPGDKGLLAFDSTSGELRWSLPSGADTYTSPQMNMIEGENLVFMFSNDGLLLTEPATGRVRLNYAWKFPQYRAVQPHLVETNIVLLPTGMNVGTRAIRIVKSNGEFSAEELWTSRDLKPDFVDLVVYQGYAYGNDNGLLTCIDLKNGKRKWKGGRYGKGQILLLQNSGLLLVAAEQGQVVLVAAAPTDHIEIASFKALEGKTWNHPVVVGDRLYVRNSQEAAGFQLSLQEGAGTVAIAGILLRSR